MSEICTDLFNKADEDGDGQLNFEEWMNFRRQKTGEEFEQGSDDYKRQEGMFKKWNKKGDGLMTLEELLVNIKKLIAEESDDSDGY